MNTTTGIFDPKLVSKPSVKRLVKKWIKALRSGGYRQAQESLRSKYYSIGTQMKDGHTRWGYCCLGVACDILDHKAWRKEGHKLGKGYVPDEDDTGSGELGKEALKSYGLHFRANSRLAAMNDNGSSFKEIADFIERELKVIK